MYLPSPVHSPRRFANFGILYVWRIDGIKICLHHGKERHGEGISSGLIFLSPDLIFIFVSVVCLLACHKHHCICCQRWIDLKWLFLISSLFCISYFFLLSTVTTAWSGCLNRKCCPSSPIPCCRAQIAFVRCFHLHSTMIHCAKRKRKFMNVIWHRQIANFCLLIHAPLVIVGWLAEWLVFSLSIFRIFRPACMCLRSTGIRICIYTLNV